MTDGVVVGRGRAERRARAGSESARAAGERASGAVAASALRRVIAAGGGLERAAEAAGLSVRTLGRWLAEDSERGELLREARRAGECERMERALAVLRG